MPQKTPLTTSESGRQFIAAWVGVVLRAHPDPVTGGAPWGIGVGHTSAEGKPVVTRGMTITRDTAMEILARDLLVPEGYVNQAVGPQLTQPRFDALVSLCSEIGGEAFLGSDVLRLLNARRTMDAGAAFGVWTRVDGKILEGLANRRCHERALFETGQYGIALDAGDDVETGVVLRQGSRHPGAVRALQADLIGLGLLPEGEDHGGFGELTEGAVRRFQEARGLTVDGRAGPATRAALAATLAKAGKPSAVPMHPLRGQAIEAARTA